MMHRGGGRVRQAGGLGCHAKGTAGCTSWNLRIFTTNPACRFAQPAQSRGEESAPSVPSSQSFQPRSSLLPVSPPDLQDGFLLHNPRDEASSLQWQEALRPALGSELDEPPLASHVSQVLGWQGGLGVSRRAGTGRPVWADAHCWSRYDLREQQPLPLRSLVA